MLSGIHHIQIAMPKGAEDDARAFYRDVLEIPEVPKPAILKMRGGVWFQTGSVRIHLGVEEPFSPSKKAHPGLLSDSLDEVAHRLKEAGFHVNWDDDLPGYRRFYTADPFLNRIEIMQAE